MTIPTIPPYDPRADDFRSYQLPDSLDATIPVTGQPSEPGTHWLARGLMAELYPRLLARPVTPAGHRARAHRLRLCRPLPRLHRLFERPAR